MNAEKSFFARNKLDYLGFKITREAIMPFPDKVEAIENIVNPTTKKSLRSFIGLINFYRDMQKHKYNFLTPPSGMTSKQVKWN